MIHVYYEALNGTNELGEVFTKGVYGIRLHNKLGVEIAATEDL